MRVIRLIAAAAIGGFALAGCAAGTPPAPTKAGTSAATTPAYALDATQMACPVTLPNDEAPPDRPESDGFNYGNEDGSLYTILRPEGILYFDGGQGEMHDDGSLDLKWPWFRGVRGQLTIRERRLDAPG